MVTITQFQCGSFPGRLWHYFRQAIRISHVLSTTKAYLLGLRSRVCVAKGGRLGCTSRGSPARFHYYGTALTTFPHWHFYDGASTITILIATYIMMRGQCMLLSLLLTRWWIVKLLIMLSLIAVSRDMQTDINFVVARVSYVLSKLCNSQTGYWRPTVLLTEPLSFD